MYFGYLYDSKGMHTRAAPLLTSKDVFIYCIQHCKAWPRILIEGEEEYCVLEVAEQQMKVPLPDGTFRYFDLSKHSVDALLQLLNTIGMQLKEPS
jgi:hypothetical protein